MNPLENEESLASRMPEMDRIEEGTKVGFAAVLSAIPVIGGSVAAGLTGSLAIADRYAQERWLLMLAQRVDELGEAVGLGQADIANDARFGAAVVKALRISRETSSQAKCKILANAACNSGSWAPNEEAVANFFMRLLERYEPEHVLILSACDDPQSFLTEHRDNVGNGQLHWIFANVVYAGIVEWEPLAKVVLRDLHQDNLINDAVGLGYDITDAAHRLSTPMGHEFLRFCADPVSDDTKG